MRSKKKVCLGCDEVKLFIYAVYSGVNWKALTFKAAVQRVNPYLRIPLNPDQFSAAVLLLVFVLSVWSNVEGVWMDTCTFTVRLSSGIGSGVGTTRFLSL